jgi:hypothetical protein
MKRELRVLPSARAGMPELAGAGDRFVKRREPSHPALRATISRVGWSPGVPFGMENSLWASRPPARYRRGAPVPPEHHSSTTSGDGARLSASERVGRGSGWLAIQASMAAATSDHTLVESVRLLEMEGVGDELFSIAAWSPLTRLSSSPLPLLVTVNSMPAICRRSVQQLGVAPRQFGERLLRCTWPMYRAAATLTRICVKAQGDILAF